MEKTTSEPKVKVNAAWCKRCGICAEFCPKDVLVMGPQSMMVAREDDCIQCKLCEIRCPDFAITVRDKK